jgi:CubicO group peptidase (beta-lactamase class C family)
MAHRRARRNFDLTAITTENFADPEFRHHSFRHYQRFVQAVANVHRGPGAPPPLPRGAQADLSAIAIDYLGGRYGLEEFLDATETDGMVVLKGGEIVYETLPNLSLDERHSIQSVSKLGIACLVGPLVESGRLDLQKTVRAHLPKIGTGYADATLQDVLDMNVSNDFSEDYSDPDADVWQSEYAAGYRVDRDNAWPDGQKPYLEAITASKGVRGTGATDYKSTNTDVMGWIIEEVTGRRVHELFSEQVWSHLGAEQNALVVLDRSGFASLAGGLIVTLHDLARWGLLLSRRGVAPDGTRVLSERWIDELLDRGKGTECPIGNGYRYHDQCMSNGRALAHTGWVGQLLYADCVADVVVAKLSSVSEPSGFPLELGDAYLDMGDAIVACLD